MFKKSPYHLANYIIKCTDNKKRQIHNVNKITVSFLDKYFKRPKVLNPQIMLFIEANKAPNHSLKEYIQKWNTLEDTEKEKYKKLEQERNKESRAQMAEYIERCTHTINSQKASSIFNSIVSQVKLPPEEANFIEISSKDLPKPPPRSLYHYIMGRLKHDEIFAELSSETIEQYKIDYENDILNYENALKQYIERQ